MNPETLQTVDLMIRVVAMLIVFFLFMLPAIILYKKYNKVKILLENNQKFTDFALEQLVETKKELESEKAARAFAEDRLKDLTGTLREYTFLLNLQQELSAEQENELLELAHKIECLKAKINKKKQPIRHE